MLKKFSRWAVAATLVGAAPLAMAADKLTILWAQWDPANYLQELVKDYEKQTGVKVVVDTESLKYVDGTEIDFVRQGLNEAFKFRNPNVKGECGCGESFNV